MLFINTVPLDCINQAAQQYHVPAVVILSVLKTEGGYTGLVKYNPCINVKISTWILSNNIADNQYFQKGVGSYNSTTSYFNTKYFNQVRVSYHKIRKGLIK